MLDEHRNGLVRVQCAEFQVRRCTLVEISIMLFYSQACGSRKGIRVDMEGKGEE